MDKWDWSDKLFIYSNYIFYGFDYIIYEKVLKPYLSNSLVEKIISNITAKQFDLNNFNLNEDFDNHGDDDITDGEDMNDEDNYIRSKPVCSPHGDFDKYSWFYDAFDGEVGALYGTQWQDCLSDPDFPLNREEYF
jgi:hypothetical protein